MSDVTLATTRKLTMKLLPCAVMGAVAFGSGGANAQLEEVIVTAQKRTQTANDIGMSVSAFSGDTMQELGVVDTSDLASLTPGFTFTDSGTGVPVYTLRGVGYNDRSYNAQSAVTVYVDEIAIPYPVMTQGALLDLERVEVLKGPQGTLYGRNTTGGAINYIAAKPTDEFQAGIYASYGRYDAYELEGYVGGSLTETFQARLAARTVQSGEGWQENNITDDELGEKDSTSIRLSLQGDFTDSFSGLLQLNWWENRSDVQAPQFVKSAFQDPTNSVVPGILEPWQSAAGGGDTPERAGWVLDQDLSYDMETFSAGLTFNYAINDSLELVSITGYSKFEDTGSAFDTNGFSGVPFDEAEPYVNFIDLQNGVGNPVDPSTWIPFADEETYPWVPNNIFSNDAEIEFFSQEFRLVGSTDQLNWVAGLYYSTDENNASVEQEAVFTSNTNVTGGVPFLSVLGATTIAEQESEAFGAYLHGEWEFSQDWRLTAGLRYSDDEIDFFGCSAELGNGSLEAFFFNATALTGAPLWFVPGFDARGCATILTDEQGNGFANGGVNDKLEEDSVSYKLALDWFVTEDIMLYTSYSRGFKAGGFPNLAANVDTQYAPTDQEQLDAVEFGVKATLLDGLMQLNGSIYHYDYEDKQLLGTVDTFFGPLSTLKNVPDSTVDGAEIDLQWSPTEGLYMQLTGSYIDSEVDKYTGPDSYAVVRNFDGSPFPYTAKYQANALVRYEWPLTGILNAFVGFDASYSDEINADFEPNGGQLDPDFVMDSYSLYNARVGLASANDSWRVTVWGRNLGDDFYTNNVQKATDQVIRYTGMPRTYGISVNYNFY